MLSSLLKFFTGRITVKASGGFYERFLNLCKSEDISIDGVCVQAGCILFNAYAKDYRQIKKAAAKAGMTASVIKRYGLPFFAAAHRERTALVCGLAFIFLFLSFMSCRVWSIEVSGNAEVFSSEIISEAEKLGLKTGAKKSKLNPESIQAQLLEKMKDKIIWVSVNTEGMRCEIQVREITKISDGVTGKPCNIISDFDGTITGCQVFSGTPEVIRGSAIKKGDLLISGVIEYENGQTGFVEARGKITARHKIKLKETVKNEEIRRYTKTKKLNTVSLFGVEIPLGMVIKGKEKCEVTCKKNIAELNSVSLPFSFNEYIYSFYEDENTENDGIYAFYSFINKLEEKLKNSLILKVSSDTYEKNGKPYFKAEADCVDSIGEKRYFSVKKK